MGTIITSTLQAPYDLRRLKAHAIGLGGTIHQALVYQDDRGSIFTWASAMLDLGKETE